jgi:hypothetical protein
MVRMRDLRRWVIAAVLALGACTGAAFGADLILGDPGTLVPSAAPGLLGPITELGRTGWNCAPERAARARTASDAGLPQN